MLIRLILGCLILLFIAACQNVQTTPDHRELAPDVGQPDASLPSGGSASGDSSEWPIEFAPDGIRGGLLSPSCHGQPSPECGPTQIYVGEALALAVRRMNTSYSFRFHGYKEDSPHPVCQQPYQPERARIKQPHGMSEYYDEYYDKVREQGSRQDFAFHWFKMCHAGPFTVQVDYVADDGKRAYVAQHHVEVFAMPSGMERHPYIPTPTPTLTTAQVRKAENLEQRFKIVVAKTDDEVFQTALLTVAFTCPAYANSKSFEINEKLTEKYHESGLEHVLEAKERGQSMTSIWAMVKDDYSQAEAYVEILEWGYNELSKMIKKPGSLLGCD